MKTIGIHLDQQEVLSLIRACNQRAQDMANNDHLVKAKEYDALAGKLEICLNFLANTQEIKKPDPEVLKAHPSLQD